MWNSVIQKFVLFAALLAATPQHLPVGTANADTTLVLKWNKAYPDDTIEKSATGLTWALSYAGARLPETPWAIKLGPDTITIDATALGFDQNATAVLLELHRKIKSTSEYRQQKSIDLGRYVTLLIGAPEHYYRLAGTPETLPELLAPYKLGHAEGYVAQSTVALKHRKISFSQPDGLSQVFVSKEIDPQNGQILEFETIELLPNGQLRFGIFNTDGRRMNAANSSHTEAGKPAKCMWCHESAINPMFIKQDDVKGFLTYRRLQDTLLGFRQRHAAARASLGGRIDYAQTQQHTLTELLYIAFMEPSAQRLSLEWNKPIAEIEEMLAGLPTHAHEEFPFLGTLYHRADLEKLAPFAGLAVSSSVREASAVEVNHLK